MGINLLYNGIDLFDGGDGSVAVCKYLLKGPPFKWAIESLWDM